MPNEMDFSGEDSREIQKPEDVIVVSVIEICFTLFVTYNDETTENPFACILLSLLTVRSTISRKV
jgi:hypothetical protein